MGHMHPEAATTDQLATTTTTTTTTDLMVEDTPTPEEVTTPEEVVTTPEEVVTTATTEGPHTVATESHLTALCTKCSSKFTCLLCVMCCFYYLLLLNIENKPQQLKKFYVPHVCAVNL